VLVEKDKIESIIPSTPAGKRKRHPQGRKMQASILQNQRPIRSHGGASGRIIFRCFGSGNQRQRKNSKSELGRENDKAPPKITNAAVKPEVPTSTQRQRCGAAIKGSPRQRRLACHQLRMPAPPKDLKFPQTAKTSRATSIRITLTAFACTKPKLELDRGSARRTSERDRGDGHLQRIHIDVVGERKRKNFGCGAAAVEKRLHDVYANTSDYRSAKRGRRITSGGVSISREGDDHDWSGKLVVVAAQGHVHGAGMTYADSDLIQIQENVIARAIASLDFSAH